jgi:predicted O-linked N-acetylglucosamine transferase (SPINDLY family)
MGVGMDAIAEAFQAAMRQHQAGQFDAAATVYTDILRLEPQHAGALHLLGVVLHTRGEHDAALEHIERALCVCKTKAVYWNNYGAVLKDLGRLPEAKTAFEKSLQIREAYPDAWSNLGLVQAELGELDEAERSLRYALKLQPRHADALRHLAGVSREKGDLEEAVRLCRDSFAIAPDVADTHALLGELLIALKRFEEAAEAHEKALAIRPQDAELRTRLGLVYSDLDDVDRAGETLRAAASLRPEARIWRLRHLSLCPTILPTAEAVTDYRADLERQLDEALEDRPPLDWRRCQGDGFFPSFQLSHHGISNRGLREKFARLFAPSFPKERPQWKGGAKIRVGFLTTAGHEGGFLRGFGGIMERLDRGMFEVVGLVSTRIAALCRSAVRSDDMRWVGFPHEIQRAGKVIREVECDVILHWHAGTDILNYFLPFLPLAPVQCIGFGTHGTTGIASLDFFLSSRLFERGEDAQEDYTERLIQFEGVTSWQPRPARPAPATRADFGLPSSGAIYFCPQRLAKFHPDFDRLLRAILEEDAAGHIVVLEGERRRAVQALRARLEKTLGQALLRRVLFLPSQQGADYYRLLGVVDVVLDSPVYSASLTGYDAFSLGVPLVTLPGKYMVQRYALGLYTRMGLRDLIACDEREYVPLAVRLGREADFRQAMRRQILGRCEVLYEDKRVVREYEHFFQEVARVAP